MSADLLAGSRSGIRVQGAPARALVRHRLSGSWPHASVPHGQGLSMRQFIADLFVTLDGFAAGEGAGPFFGYAGPGLDRWIHDRLDEPQLMVMGRVTYEALAGISATATDEISARMNELPKAVFSNSLREPLAWPNTRLVTGDAGEAIRALKQQSRDPLRSIGSISLVNSMIGLGLVDRLRVMVFPLILGRSGREPAYAGYPDTSLDLVSSTVLDGRLTLLEYRPLPAAG